MYIVIHKVPSNIVTLNPNPLSLTATSVIQNGSPSATCPSSAPVKSRPAPVKRAFDRLRVKDLGFRV